jgi:DNA-binding MarR family transcriptional regulator
MRPIDPAKIDPGHGHGLDADTKRFKRRQAELWLDLSRIHSFMDRRVATLFVDEGLEGITPAQSSVLLVLFQHAGAPETERGGPMTVRRLARELGVSEVTVSRFVKALVQNGWVERNRNPDDQREFFLAPTGRAREALPAFITVSNGLLDCAFRGLDREEVEGVLRLMERIRDNLTGASDP